MEITFEPIFEFAKEHTPIPAKKMLPDWIKNLPPVVTGAMGDTFQTAKKCPPMIDFLTSGYYMLSPGNFKFRREVNNGEEDIFIEGDMVFSTEESDGRNATFPSLGFHTHEQAPIVINGIRKSIWKFYQFWTIHTPPGYSCMYLPPLFFHQHFQMFPAVVDTDDGFGVPQAFPAMSTFNDEGTHEWEVKKGEPIALVVPFKRDTWEHKIADIDISHRDIALIKHKQSYVNDFHKKKNFK